MHQNNITYLDFEIVISPKEGCDYWVNVVHSPAGEARAVMRFPFDELALDSGLKDIKIALLSSNTKRRLSLLPNEQSVQDFGKKLFEALFSDYILSCFEVSLERALQKRAGVRLKLNLTGSPELAAVPWEYLYYPKQGEYLCLIRSTPIVRYIEVHHSPEPIMVEPPLQILGLIANPNQQLDAVNEQNRIITALNPLVQRGLVQITWLEDGTWRDLQKAMRQGPWHVFHFIGHGGFDTMRDEGLVELSDEHGQPHGLRATSLARILANHNSLRLVLLNSCSGAIGGKQDIFSSTASLLVRRGIPAVLAMQHEISDRAAIEFSTVFYETIADGYPVDFAVSEGRTAISLGTDFTVEWGTPVLFMHTPSGALFEMQSPAGVKVKAVDGGTTIYTATYIAGDVSVSQGDFVGRDQVNETKIETTQEIEPTPTANEDREQEHHTWKESLLSWLSKIPRWSWLIPVAMLLLLITFWTGLLDFPTASQATPILISKTPTVARTLTRTPKATITPEPTEAQVLFKPYQKITSFGKGKINAIAVSPLGDTIAVGASIGFYLFDLSTLEEIFFIETDAQVTAIRFTPDGKSLGIGFSNGTLQQRWVSDGTILRTFEGHQEKILSLAFSSDGNFLASGSTDETACLWRVTTGEQLHVLRHANVVRDVDFSQDGRILATASDKVHLWQVWDGSDQGQYRTGGSYSAISVAFSPDNKILAGSGDEIYLWDFSTSGVNRIIPNNNSHHLTFSPVVNSWLEMCDI